MALSKIERRKRIKYRIRKIVFGTAARPRLSVFRSNKEIYAQLIDDTTGTTLASSSSRQEDIAKRGNKTEMASLVGKAIAEKAIAMKVSAVSFDRNGYLYHGRVKALADGARDAGLKF